jgi:hypothetical protein
MCTAPALGKSRIALLQSSRNEIVCAAQRAAPDDPAAEVALKSARQQMSAI